MIVQANVISEAWATGHWRSLVREKAWAGFGWDAGRSSPTISHTSLASATSPLISGGDRIYSATTGGLIAECDNVPAPPTLYDAKDSYYSPNYIPGFLFSPDANLLMWSSDGALIAIPTSRTQLSLTVSPSTLPGGLTSTATVTVSPATANSRTVTLTSSSPDIVVPASVTVPSHTASFSIKTLSVSAKTGGTITASLAGASATATLNLVPASLASVVCSPNPVVGGMGTTGTVTLTGPAPASGWKVTLSDSKPSFVDVPTSVVVPAGKTTATFVTTTKAYTSGYSATIKATDAYDTQVTTLNVLGDSIKSLTLSPSTVTGAAGTVGTVTLNYAAPAGGWTVTLSSSNSKFIGVPTSVTIPAGQTSATFNVTTKAYTSTYTASVSASDLTSAARATITVKP